MEYHNRGYDARHQRDPREHVATPPPWYAADDHRGPDHRGPDDRGPDHPWPTDNRWSEGSWSDSRWSDERWSDNRWSDDHWSDERDEGERGHAPAAWAAGEHTGSWSTAPTWVPRQRSGLTDDDPRWGHGRVLDHDDWYESAAPQPSFGEPVHRPHAHRAADPDDQPDDDAPTPSYLTAVFSTLVWYGVPVVLYVLWALTLGGRPEAGCEDPSGAPCGAPRTEALADLVDGVPRLATALALSVVVAIVVRWANSLWRGLTVGFAGAVVGAGIATVIFSLIARGAA